MWRYGFDSIGTEMEPVAELHEAELELWIPSWTTNFLTSRGTINLSMKTVFHIVIIINVTGYWDISIVCENLLD
jgi:hypothetical protein